MGTGSLPKRSDRITSFRKKASLMPGNTISRRLFFQVSRFRPDGGIGGAGLIRRTAGEEKTGKEKPVEKKKPTKFQIACMTLPYSHLPLERALKGSSQRGIGSSPGAPAT